MPSNVENTAWILCLGEDTAFFDMLVSKMKNKGYFTARIEPEDQLVPEIMSRKPLCLIVSGDMLSNNLKSGLRQIKSQFAQPPLLILTDAFSLKALNNTYIYGFDEFLPRPVDFDQLMLLINKRLEEYLSKSGINHLSK